LGPGITSANKTRQDLSLPSNTYGVNTNQLIVVSVGRKVAGCEVQGPGICEMYVGSRPRGRVGACEGTSSGETAVPGNRGEHTIQYSSPHSCSYYRSSMAVRIQLFILVHL
jgi:hypothetical protein